MLCRIACYYLLLGVEQFQERKLEESVEQLTVAYIVNQRLLEDPPIMANPKLKVNHCQPAALGGSAHLG